MELELFKPDDANKKRRKCPKCHKCNYKLIKNDDDPNRLKLYFHCYACNLTLNQEHIIHTQIASEPTRELKKIKDKKKMIGK